MNRPTPYAEKFEFELPQTQQVDPDVTSVKDEELMQAVGSAKKELNLETNKNQYQRVIILILIFWAIF